jgi:hypothetical protein
MKPFTSQYLGPQLGEPLCDGSEMVVESTNSSPQTNAQVWNESLKSLSASADEAYLKTYPPRN